MTRPQAGVPWLLGFLLLLGLLTQISFDPRLRYTPVGPELLNNPDFSAADNGWTGNALARGGELTAGGVVIRNAGRGYSGLRQDLLLAPGTRVLLSAQVASSGVLRGVKPWHLAQINLVQFGTDGARLPDQKAKLLWLQGDHAWQPLLAARVLGDGAHRLRLALALAQAQGEFSVRDLSLRQAREHAGLLWLGRLTLLGWALAGLWSLRLLLGGAGRPWGGVALGGVALACLLLLLLPSAAPDSLPRQGLDLVAEVRDQARAQRPPNPPTSTGGQIRQPSMPDLLAADKLGHALLFTLLALLAALTYRRTPWYRQALYLLAFALVSEQLQRYTVARGPGWDDLRFDVYGIALGLLLGRMLVAVWTRLRPGLKAR